MAVVIGLTFDPGRARAQDAPATPCQDLPEVCGKRAFEEGIAAYNAGEHARALTLFREAQAARPHPSILLNIALCEVKIGLVVEALAHLEQVFADPQTPADLLETVRRERDQVAAQVASVSIATDGAELYVDGKRAGGSPPAVRVNPGQHQVRVVARGKTVVDRSVALKPAERMEVAVASLSAEPRVEPRPVSPPRLETLPQHRPPRGISPWWVAAGAGLTAVLGAGALYSHLDTSRAFDDFKRDLPWLSREEAERRVEQGGKMETRTNWLLAGTLVVGGMTALVAFVWADWGGKRPGLALAASADRLMVRARF